MTPPNERLRPPNYQLHTTYFLPRIEAVAQGWLGAGHSTRPGVSGTFDEYGTAVAGIGGRFCLDVLHTRTVDNDTGAFSGWGGSGCYAALYDTGGALQHRIGGGFNIFVLDNQLLIPIHLNFIYRDIPDANPQYGGVLNLGVRYFFRTLDQGPGINPYVGADFGIGGVGGRDGGFGFLELQVNGGVQARF